MSRKSKKILGHFTHLEIVVFNPRRSLLMIVIIITTKFANYLTLYLRILKSVIFTDRQIMSLDFKKLGFYIR